MAGSNRKSSIARAVPVSRNLGAFLLAGTALAAGPALGQAPQSGPLPGGTVQMPAISVQGTGGWVPEDSLRTPEYSASPKFTAPLLDTPKSVTVINSEVMKQTGVTTLFDALRTTPGITMGMGEGGQPFGDLPHIRGFNATSDIYVDGVRDPGSQSRETFNVERIEITKGPGGAYTGTGATGGSVNIISKAPKLETFHAGSATVGTDLTRRVTGDVNYKLSDTAAIRLNGMYHDAEVAGRDEVELNRWGLAPSLAVGLGSPTRATFSYYHLQTDDIPDYGLPYGRRRLPNGTFATTGRPVDVDRDTFYGLTNRDFRKTEADIGTIQLEHDFSSAFKLSNATRYGETKNDYIVTNPDDTRNNVVNGTLLRNPKSRNSTTTTAINQTNLAGDFTTGIIRHSYVAGVEVSKVEMDNRPYVIATGPFSVTGAFCPTVNTAVASGYNCTTLNNPNAADPWRGAITPGALTSTRTTTKSAYAFDTIELSPQWSINGGIRFDDYDTKATGPITATSNPNGQNQSSFFNYQLGVVYKPASNGSIYVAYGTSSNPSGEAGGDGSTSNIASTSRATSNINLDPEENRIYEIGTKWNLFDNQAQVTVAIFQTEKTNARAVDAGGNLSLVGEQRIRGIEIGLSGNITDKWRMFGGYAFLDSEILDDGPAAFNDGKKFPQVPSHSATLFTSYRIVERWTIGGSAIYMSKVYGDAANTVGVPSYWRFDTMASYQITDNIDIQLNIYNIFDERYFDRAYTTHMASVAPGRVALLTTSFKF